MERKEHIIDANGKRLGKIATEAATVLLGKDSADFTKNVVAPVSVKIVNANGVDVSEKRSTEIFQRYTGYPGGRRTETLGHLAERRGYPEVIRRIVSGMLPKNKLHKPRMHNLEITE